MRTRSRGDFAALEQRARSQAGLPLTQRTYLTHSELEDTYGARAEDLDLIEQLAHEHDLSVTRRSAAARSIVLHGRLGDLLNLFPAQLQMYHHSSGTYRGRQGEILMPKALDGIVTGVFGFDTRRRRRHSLRAYRAVASLAAADGVPATTYAKRYEFPEAHQGRTLDGSGQTLAIIELGGGFRGSDLKVYFQEIAVAQPNVTRVVVDNAPHAPTTADSADGEVMLDIEVAGTVVPKAKIVVYFAPNNGDQGFIDGISAAVHDSERKPGVISISWGSPESTTDQQGIAAFHEIFVAAAALGITVCVATGDHGTADEDASDWDGKIHVDHPGVDDFVIACGGTQIDSNGKRCRLERRHRVQYERGRRRGLGRRRRDQSSVPRAELPAECAPSRVDRLAYGGPRCAGYCHERHQLFHPGRRRGRSGRRHQRGRAADVRVDRAAQSGHAKERGILESPAVCECRYRGPRCHAGHECPHQHRPRLFGGNRLGCVFGTRHAHWNRHLGKTMKHHTSRTSHRLAACLLGACCSAQVVAQSSFVPWLTRAHDNGRSGWNSQETVLTQDAVTAKGVFRATIIPVIGDARGMEAQPLISPNVKTPLGVRDVMILPSMANVIRGVDAHDGSSIWQVTLDMPVTSSGQIDSKNINQHWGCLSTGVIDTASQRLYQVCWVSPDKSGNPATARYYMYVRNVGDGSSVTAPVLLQGGTGAQDFNAQMRKQRAALLETDVKGVRTVFGCSGTVYETAAGAAGYCFAFDTYTNRFTALLPTTAGEGAGIWMGGGGPAADADGNIYLVTGNGDFDGKTQWGESFLKLKYVPPHGNTPATLSVSDHWTPWTDSQRTGQQPAAQMKMAGMSAPSEALRPVGGGMNMSLKNATRVNSVNERGHAHHTGVSTNGARRLGG